MKIPKIAYQPNESLTELFQNNRELVFDRFFECIQFGLKNNLTDVYFFELGETGFFLESNILDWNESLESCIDHYSFLENYEKCVECKKMQDEVKQRTKN